MLQCGATVGDSCVEQPRWGNPWTSCVSMVIHRSQWDSTGSCESMRINVHTKARACDGAGCWFVKGRGCHKDAHPPLFFFFYYGIHSLMFGGYPPTAIGYPPTAIGYPPTAIGYPPTAIGYPPAAIVGRIGHSEFFFSLIMAPPGERSAVKLGTRPLTPPEDHGALAFPEVHTTHGWVGEGGGALLRATPHKPHAPRHPVPQRPRPQPQALPHHPWPPRAPDAVPVPTSHRSLRVRPHARPRGAGGTGPAALVRKNATVTCVSVIAFFFSAARIFPQFPHILPHPPRNFPAFSRILSSASRNFSFSISPPPPPLLHRHARFLSRCPTNTHGALRMC